MHESAPTPPPSLLHRLFEARAAQAPQALALLAGSRTFTARQLDQAANGVAHALVAAGVAPGDAVGLYLPRSAEAVVAVLGIVKASARWVPISPEHPLPRRKFISEDAGLRAILTRPHYAETVGDFSVLTPLIVDDITPAPAPPPVADPPEGGLNILYTSGSTGLPKGVCGTHGAFLNRIRWMWRALPFAPGEILAHRAALDFVDSVWELFGGLLAGVPTAVISPEDAADPFRLVTALADAGVTRLTLVPSLLSALLTARPELGRALPALKWWTVSGEPLNAPLVRRFRAAVPEGVLINLYGSTEVAADVTCAVFAAEADFLADPVPIGAAIDHAILRVLDTHGQTVQPGEIGELFVGGPVLANGYHRRADETARRFVELDGQRFFRTGDRVWQVGDTLFYAGRQDHQVKIRGVRIELEEVEHALRRVTPALESAIAVVQQDGDAEDTRALVVFVTPGRLHPDRLRAALAAELPAHSVPARIHALDALPRTPTGKLDRQALRDLRPTLHRDLPEEKRPRDAIEQAIAAVWAERFHVDPVARDDDFRALGGDSLGWVAVLAALQARLGRPGMGAPPPSTVAELAALFRGEVPEFKEDFTTSPMRADQAEQVEQAMADWFAGRDPTTAALGIPAAVFKRYAHAVVQRCLKTGYSLVAMQGDRLVGFCISDDFTAPIDYGDIHPALEPVIDFNDDLEGRYRALRGPLQPGKVLELPMAATAPDVEGFAILRALELRALQEATARGFECAIAVCTHPVTDFLARSLGFEELIYLDYGRYTFNGHHVLASLAPGGAWLLERPLAGPA